MLTGLNHITLATENISESIEFYSSIGFKLHVRWEKGAYLSLSDLWFCLSKSRVDSNDDYSHIAFSICDSDFEKLRSFLKSNKVQEWQENSSEGKSIYFLDPNGHKLEAHIGGLESRLKELKEKPYNQMVWFENEM